MQLWQRYISTALVPLAGTSVTVRREMGIFCNHVSVRIEGKINSIVQRMTDGKLPSLSLSLSRSLHRTYVSKSCERKQRLFHIWVYNSRNKRNWISSPRTTTSLSLASIPNLVCWCAISWPKWRNKSMRVWVGGIEKCFWLKLVSLFIRTFLVSSSHSHLPLTRLDACWERTDYFWIISRSFRLALQVDWCSQSTFTLLSSSSRFPLVLTIVSFH